jgi:hypothetical protein
VWRAAKTTKAEADISIAHLGLIQPKRIVNHPSKINGHERSSVDQNAAWLLAPL